VYTPPGYDSNGGRTYPVLFLLHGSWDNDAAWAEVGRAGIIMDNLLAERNAEPMVIVMPDGHPYPSFETATRARNLAQFERDLLEEILPLIERVYRVSPQRTRRAIAGLSMGGTQSLHLGLTMEHFGSIGAFSAPGDVPRGRTFEELLRETRHARGRVELLWLACGRNDAYFAEAERVHAELARYGIPHVWRETDGRHTWTVWRRHFADFVTTLFRPSANDAPRTPILGAPSDVRNPNARFGEVTKTRAGFTPLSTGRKGSTTVLQNLWGSLLSCGRLAIGRSASRPIRRAAVTNRRAGCHTCPTKRPDWLIL
jgi:enterochelin esterase-like enzyme